MLYELSQTLTTTAVSTPYVEPESTNSGRKLVSDAYVDIMNWIGTQSDTTSMGFMLQSNLLQLSEDEIIEYLDSEQPPWKISNETWGEMDLVADWIVVKEIRIHEDFENATQHAMKNYTVNPINYALLAFNVEVDQVVDRYSKAPTIHHTSPPSNDMKHFFESGTRSKIGYMLILFTFSFV